MRNDGLLRRVDDQRLAELLLEGGLAEGEVYVLPDAPDVEDQIVALDGTFVESRGRPLRRWLGFPSQAFTTKTRRGLFYEAFAAAHRIGSVRQIRVSAPLCAVPLEILRSVHEANSARLLERLRYGMKKYAPSLRIDLIAAEIVRDGPGVVYLHFHLVSRGGTADELEALRRYWIGEGAGRVATGWLWWDADGDEDRTCRHPAALVQYVSKGLAEALDDDWQPEELAELHRQTRGLSLVRAVGEFRCWLGRLEADGLTVRRNEYGIAQILPKRPPTYGVRRLKERLFSATGFTLIRLVAYDFGDGSRRPAWLVRGPAGLTADVVGAFYSITEYPTTPESLDPAKATSLQNLWPNLLADLPNRGR